MGSNSKQAFAAIEQGMDFVKDFSSMVSSTESDSGTTQADLLETDAKSDAWEAQRAALKEAREVRDENEQERSREHAEWGGSNLAMSGSKALVRNAKATQDMQEEEDILYEGQRTSDSILSQARNRANLLRISNGSSAKRSTLSMGSSIYGPRS